MVTGLFGPPLPIDLADGDFWRIPVLPKSWKLTSVLGATTDISATMPNGQSQAVVGDH